MTTKQIDYILELSQTLNFNRAAENLYTSQPTLTYQIKSVEEELGFQIFNRTSKGVTLTPAGFQFVITLRNIRTELLNAIEQAQNFSSRYKEDIKIFLPVRSSIYFLSEIIKKFQLQYPDTSITPIFFNASGIDLFLKGEIDLFLGIGDQCKRISEIEEHHLYDSNFYLITKIDDPLAKKEQICKEDLAGQTLMIGGGSPPVLRKLQQDIINSVDVEYFNSSDHDTTLTNVSLDKGVCISPGLLNDHNNEFAWTPFVCTEILPCYLYKHKNDRRKSVKDFIQISQAVYQKYSDFDF